MIEKFHVSEDLARSWVRVKKVGYKTWSRTLRYREALPLMQRAGGTFYVRNITAGTLFRVNMGATREYRMKQKWRGNSGRIYYDLLPEEAFNGTGLN